MISTDRGFPAETDDGGRGALQAQLLLGSRRDPPANFSKVQPPRLDVPLAGGRVEVRVVVRDDGRQGNGGATVRVALGRRHAERNVRR